MKFDIGKLIKSIEQIGMTSKQKRSDNAKRGWKTRKKNNKSKYYK